MTEQPASMGDQDLCLLSDLSRYSCLHFGLYTALIYEDQQQQEVREYTNFDIAREAAQLSEGLRALGIEKGARVMVMMINCPEVVIAYQAIARAGGVIIPVMPLLKPPEVQYIAQNSGAKAIFTNPILLPLVQAALASVSTMQHIIVTGAVSPAQASSSQTVHAYTDIVARGAKRADDFLSTEGDIAVSPDDPAVILYTSGTTGNPKGVLLTHRSLIANAVSARGGEFVTRDEMSQLAVLPLAHAYGILVSNVFFLRGMTVVALPRFDTSAVLSAIERYRIVSFSGVPAMFVALLYSPDADTYDTSSLQWCVSGSAPLPVTVLEAFEQKFGCVILEGYGLSEASAALTAHSQEMPRKPGSVGKPLAGVELLIVDAGDQPLPAGEIGEVIARGLNVMQSYYNMPEETAAALKNGWLHTGDMGYLDEDGYLYIVERKKDLIIRGGFNVYPRDVEEALNRHPAVIESAVIGVPSERMGEEVMAFVVTSAPVDADTLMAFCRESLANYKTPSQIEFVHALPRNAVGKIDKKELRKRYVH